jgi:hypothetical protein
VLARILHAFGMDRRQPSKLRIIGILGSWGVLLAFAGYGLYITSMEPRAAETRTAPFRLGASPDNPLFFRGHETERGRTPAVLGSLG